MKKLLTLLIAVAFFACTTGEKSNHEKSEKPVEYVETTINIGGMHCNNCVNSIEKGITALNGIQSVAVTLDDSTAVVKYDATQLALNDIEKAVEKRGFKVKSTE